MNTQIIDTVKTYLRNTSSPYAIVDSSTAALSITARGILKFVIAPAGSYFLSVRHRNSIETWSASVITIATGGTVNYDFSTAKSQAYGNNMIQIDTSPVNFGVYSGDENQDGFVNLTDVVKVYNNANAFVNGYVASDMNGDNITDLSDLVITSNNAGAFVSKITP